jgi:hypothetical protein
MAARSARSAPGSAVRKGKKEKSQMASADRSEGKATPEAQASREHGSGAIDKYAEARKAKKKAKRIRHRAKLKRSHTKG